MKLAIITHKIIKRDGQGRVNYEISKEAIARGHHLILIASEVSLELANLPQVTWIKIEVEKIPTELLKKLYFSQRSGAWLKQHQSEIDMAIANGTITNAATQVNIVHFVHNSWLNSPDHIWRSRRDLYGFYQWLYSATNAYWEKQVFPKTPLVIAVSQKIATELQQMHLSQEQIAVIPNGIDLEEFSPGEISRDQWQLPPHTPLALFAGDIRFSRKNLDTVLHALVEVPNLHLAVAGITEGSPYLKLAESLNLNSRVHWLGLRKDIPELMKAVDFFVFPSRYEPFGLVVIEAMASGLAVITAKTTGASALITSEGGIVLDDPNDKKALAESMEKLANNPELRTKMGQEARAIALQHSWQKMAQTYLNLLETLP